MHGTCAEMAGTTTCIDIQCAERSVYLCILSSGSEAVQAGIDDLKSLTILLSAAEIVTVMIH